MSSGIKIKYLTPKVENEIQVGRYGFEERMASQIRDFRRICTKQEWDVIQCMYLNGYGSIRTLREVGSELGMHFTTVAYHLRKAFKKYRKWDSEFKVKKDMGKERYNSRHGS